MGYEQAFIRRLRNGRGRRRWGGGNEMISGEGGFHLADLLGDVAGHTGNVVFAGLGRFDDEFLELGFDFREEPNDMSFIFIFHEYIL